MWTRPQLPPTGNFSRQHILASLIVASLSASVFALPQNAPRSLGSTSPTGNRLAGNGAGRLPERLRIAAAGVDRIG